MIAIGFDAKDFSRSKVVERNKQILFFSPLGVGVKTSDLEELRKTMVEKTQELNKSFNIPTRRIIQNSRLLIDEIGHRKTIPFCDNLVKSLENLIDSVFVSYVILPPKDIPEVEVGGYHCPRLKIKTMDFLRKLTPSFPYLTAWSYLGRSRNHISNLFLDGFSGKRTTAWDDLSAHDLKVFPRGDECNEIIALADMLAYLTDKKLWDEKIWLRPDAVTQVWSAYDFKIETRFLDKKVLSKIQWYSDEQIILDRYLAHPLVFVHLDGLSMKRFVNFEVYRYAIEYAFKKRGGLQGFDPDIDSRKVRDGDVYVYAGEKAQARANTLKHMYDIETYSLKELREKIEKPTAP